MTTDAHASTPPRSGRHAGYRPTPARRLALNPLARRVVDRDGFPLMRGAFPVVGHAPAIMTDPIAFTRLAEREAGPLYWSELGFGLRSLVYARADAFQLFKNKVTSSSILREAAGDLLGESLIVQDGASHHHARSAMNATFTPKGITAVELGPVFAEIIARRVARWPGRGAFPLLAETRELVLSLMFRMLGVADADLPAWRVQYERLMLLAIRVPLELPGSPSWLGRRARAWLDARILELVAAVRADASKKGLLAEIVRARDEGGDALTDRELVDNLRLLILAGHETSAAVMAWMTILLAERDDVWDALCAEALAAPDVPRSPRDLKAFPYAEAVFRETLRMHPPVTADARKVVEPFELAGRRVPAGTAVSIPIAYISRLPELYPDPDRFDPTRWLARREPVSPIELVQFGGGPHFCLGYHVAWLEIVQYAVTLARALAPRGLRPRVEGDPTAARFLPLMHPSPRTRVRVE